MHRGTRYREVGDPSLSSECSIRFANWGNELNAGEKAFVHPDAFIPERWTTWPELILDRAAFSHSLQVSGCSRPGGPPVVTENQK
jgi:hypothetical protein